MARRWRMEAVQQRTYLSTAMARRWRMEAVQQRNYLSTWTAITRRWRKEAVCTAEDIHIYSYG